MHSNQLAMVGKCLSQPGPRGSVQVTHVVTHTTHEPESEYEFAERMRSDATNLSDVALIVSVLGVLRARILEVQAAQLR